MMLLDLSGSQIGTENYCIVVNFRGSVGSENFTDKTFMDCLKPNISGCGMPQNFMEKTFADGSRTSKFAKVFSLESFLLYGIVS